jgi:hypothetical protein
VTEVERQLVALYDQASPAVRRRGRAWYPETNRRLREIAQRTGTTPAHAAAVFSIVSPAAQLTTALNWTEEILEGKRAGGRYPNVQGPKIEAALAVRRPVHRISGPKVNAFYRAIMGDTTALVLDRWAAYAAGHQRDRDIPRAVRREIEAAYRAAAAACGETVRAFQAIVWIHVRESTPRSNGVLPRLADVTT